MLEDKKEMIKILKEEECFCRDFLVELLIDYENHKDLIMFVSSHLNSICDLIRILEIEVKG